MAKPQQRLITPKVYEVGVDVSQELINELTLKLADWFVEIRPNIKEPTAVARQKIKDCLEGLTSEGKPWYAAANSSFETRMRMACRFDVEKMEGLRKASEEQLQKREKKQAREAKRKLKTREDANIPDELRQELRNTTKYGENASVFLSSAEHKRWLELKHAYQEQFPELRTINAEAELNKLLNLLIVDERQQMNLLQGKKVEVLDMKGITDQIVALKKALGIHPEQVKKNAKDAEGGTIGEVVARLETMGDWKKIREKFFAEEMLQLYQMYHAPSPRPEGHQLDDIGLFSATRCRTCECASCGERNYVGIKIEEIEQYLKDRDYIEVEDEPEPEVVEEEETPDVSTE